MKLLSLFVLLLSNMALANLHLAPPSFDYKDGKAVFIDISKATYDINYYPRWFTSRVKTTFTFKVEEAGYPIIDFVPRGMRIKIDGERVRYSKVSSPGKVTSYKVIKKYLEPGEYTMSIRTRVKRGITFGFGSVNSGFFIKDLKQKKFLEKYVPANLEYDQYKATFNVKVHSRRKHEIMANGKVETLGHNEFSVDYPAFYSASSFYFHVFRTSKYKRLNSSFTSMDGREIPVKIYTKWFLKPESFLKKAKRVFHELEADYGVYPHPEILIYGMHIKGGMEYPGATATSLRSLGHEMFHFYFAKSLIPADGNSGWMDEGLASWRDRGYKTLEHPGYESFNLGGHSVYKRNTDKNSYKVGRAFFGYLNSKFDLKAALRNYFHAHKNSLVTTNDMIQSFESQTGLSLRADFTQFVLGGGSKRKNYVEQTIVPENPHHPDYTEEDMKNML